MTEQLAVVDGVESGVLQVTILAKAIGRGLQGKLATLKLADPEQHWLVRFGDISLHNPIHRDDRFAPLIQANGSVPEWSGFTDIERGTAEVIAVLNEHGEHIGRLLNPRSGTPVLEVDRSEIERFWRDTGHHAVVGDLARSAGAPASMINRHFGSWDVGGYGEARHMAIYGRNGSGKSVWVLMLLACKVCAHHRMGFIIPDTQGDFADPTKHDRGSFRWNFRQVCETAGVEVDVISVSDIALTSKAVLKPLLSACLLRIYSMSGDKANELAGRIVEGLFDKEVDPDRLTAETIAREVVEKIEYVYAKASRQEHRDDAENVLRDLGRLRQLDNHIARQIKPFFEGDIKMKDLVWDVLRRGRKVIIRMEDMPDHQQMAVMRELMAMLKRTAQKIYKSGQELANAIVVLDEAARWLPQGEETETKQEVQQGIRETRKAGVGWWIVGQSPSDVDKSVLRQSHMKWFGRGLGVGADAKHLEESLEKDGLQQYKDLQRQPSQFFWVGVGLDNNIGHDNTHVAVIPFGGDASQALIAANPHIWNKGPTL